MLPLGIVEVVDVVAYCLLHLILIPPGSPVKQFCFQGAKDAFCHGIVPTVSSMAVGWSKPCYACLLSRWRELIYVSVNGNIDLVFPVRLSKALQTPTALHGELSKIHPPGVGVERRRTKAPVSKVG